MYPLYSNPSDRLKQSLWYALPKSLRRTPPEFYQEFWALHNISFEVNKGETVGIVGHNGAGKSTLLQIIAGTLTPTQGEVQINGNVAALLQLGSGFNPEFTGRENIYMYGAILGLSQAEIDDLYQDIITFADIGQFIDQPMKLYSSGMRMRLGFAVQAFVPKQVLILDEVFAVGDLGFKSKCFAALERFKENGGTVLLVSHNVQTILRQCERCLLLHRGKLLADGSSKPVTDLYQKLIYSNVEQTAEILSVLRRSGLQAALSLFQAEPEKQEAFPGNETQADSHRKQTSGDEPVDYFDPNLPVPDEVTYGSGDAEILDCGVYNSQGKPVNVLVMGYKYQLRYRVKFYKAAEKVRLAFSFKTVDGILVAGVHNDLERQPIDFVASGAVIEASFDFRANLAPAMYFLTASVRSFATLAEDSLLQRRVDLCSLRVTPRDHRATAGIAYFEPCFTYRLLVNDEGRSN